MNAIRTRTRTLPLFLHRILISVVMIIDKKVTFYFYLMKLIENLCAVAAS